MRLKRSLLILMFFVALAAIHLLIYTHNIKLKYEVDALKISRQKLYSENRNLRAEVERKSSLSRIENVARTKLNMIRPDNVNYIRKITAE